MLVIVAAMLVIVAMAVLTALGALAADRLKFLKSRPIAQGIWFGVLAIIVLMIVNHDILLNRGKAFQVPAWRIYRTLYCPSPSSYPSGRYFSS